MLTTHGDDPMSRAQALFSLAGLYAMRGRADESRASYALLRTILDDLGATLWSAASQEIAAFAELALGDPIRAGSMLDDGIVLLRRFDAVGYMSVHVLPEVLRFGAGGQAPGSVSNSRT